MEFVDYTIGELSLRVRTGKTPPTKNPLYFSGNINWLTPPDLKGQKIINESERKISELALEENKAFLFEPDTILISTIGDIGKACIIDKPSASNQQLTGIVVDKNIISPELFYYWILRSKSLLNNKANKAIISILGNKLLKKIKVSFPKNHEEQFKIVAKLNKIQELINKRLRTIDLLDEHLSSIFLEMFLESPKSKYWALTTINEANVVKHSIQGIGRKANIEKNGMPFLRMNNLTSNGEIDLSDLKWIVPTKKELSTFELNNRNVLFNRTNSPDLIGKIAVWDKGDGYTFAGYLVRLILDENLINPYYFASYFNSKYGRKVLRNKARISGNLANVSASRLKKQKILIPPIDLQNEYENIYFKIKAQKDRYRKSLTILETFFKSSLQNSFSENSDVDEEQILEDLLKDFEIVDLKKGQRINYLLDWLKKGKQKERFSSLEKYYTAIDKLLELLEDGIVKQDNMDNNIKLRTTK